MKIGRVAQTVLEVVEESLEPNLLSARCPQRASHEPSPLRVPTQELGVGMPDVDGPRGICDLDAPPCVEASRAEEELDSGIQLAQRPGSNTPDKTAFCWDASISATFLGHSSCLKPHPRSYISKYGIETYNESEFHRHIRWTGCSAAPLVAGVATPMPMRTDHS